MAKRNQLEHYRESKEGLNKFAFKTSYKYIFKALHIDGWSKFSKACLVIGVVGLILFFLNFIQLISWFFNWFYVFITFILVGFLTAKPNERYNFIVVISLFTILAFVPSEAGQLSLNLGLPNYESNTAIDFGEEVYEYIAGEDDAIDFDDDDHIGYDGYLEGDDQVTGEPVDISEFYDTVNNLQENPMSDIIGFVGTVNDVLNWIVFIAMLVLGGSALGDVATGKFGDIAKKAGAIALCVLIISIVYTIFNWAGLRIKSIWETVGDSYFIFLKNVGLTQLNQQGDHYANHMTVFNGLFAWIPLIVPITMITLAFYFRHIDIKSLLFTKKILEENYMEVQRTDFSKPMLIFILSCIVYIAGYFLVTAKPSVIIDPYITLAFYIGTMVILMLIANKVLILNKERNLNYTIMRMGIWTVFGIVFLSIWFCVFQPTMYNLGLIDSPSGYLSLSQGQGKSIFETSLFEQFFLVALPETVIFQIGFVGVGNRVYFWLRKGRLLEKEEKRLENRRIKLENDLSSIYIDDHSLSKQNLGNMVRAVALQKKITEINVKIRTGKFQKLPKSYFIFPFFISATIGSFFFSWYHSFRRGIDFVTWWQNPLLGMTYFGAGFFLCLIAFFCYPSAILVHAFNNIIAIAMSG